MHLTYARLCQKPASFLNLTGLKLSEFEKISVQVKLAWNQKIEGKRKSPAGRPSVLKHFEDKLLAIFIYYRTYITHEFLGYLFGLHNANICRLFRKIEPIIAGAITIKKDRTLTKEKILKILADVTEQPIQRPKKASKQKASYSGKKKRHTQKMELVVTGEGKIVSTSASYPGRCHDFYIRKEEKPLPRGADKYVDSGYQGLQKRTDSVHLPEKKKRKQPLTQEQRKHNQELASVRIAVEHKIREIKIFKILSEVYRNFQRKHHMRFNIIAAVVNFKHGF